MFNLCSSMPSSVPQYILHNYKVPWITQPLWLLKGDKIVPPFLLPCNAGFTIDQPPLSSTSVKQAGQWSICHPYVSLLPQRYHKIWNYKNDLQQVKTNLSLWEVLHLGHLEDGHILHGHLSKSQLSESYIKSLKNKQKKKTMEHVMQTKEIKWMPSYNNKINL